MFGQNVPWKIRLKNFVWKFEKKRFTNKVNAQIKRMMADCSQKTFYIINRKEFVGLFSYIQTSLRYIEYAMNNDMIPIIDMRGIKNPFLEDGEEETVNWWDLYFEQPTKYKLSDVDWNNVTYCEELHMSKIPYSTVTYKLEKSVWYWGKMYETFFKLKDSTRQYCEKEYLTLLSGKQSKIIGCVIRGSDYKYVKGMPIQPTCDQVFTYIDKLINRGYEFIYLATEEKCIVERFVEKYGERVIVNRRMYYDNIDFTDTTVNDIRFQRDNDRFLGGIEYLSSVLLLSRCDYLVGAASGALFAAMYLNNDMYKGMKLFYLGLSK